MGARNPAYWSLDNNGSEKAYCCFNSNALDFARFGQLYLNNGKWNGVQLVPEWYVKESTVPANYLVDEQGNAITKYGYAWWTRQHKQHLVYYARGILGQYIFVVPDKNMVVVRLGHKRDKSGDDDHPLDIAVYLDAAFDICK